VCVCVFAALFPLALISSYKLIRPLWRTVASGGHAPESQDDSEGITAAPSLMRHLFFIAANINASIQSLQFPNLRYSLPLSAPAVSAALWACLSLPLCLTRSPCRVVCLQFPDPWHAKHGKRRVMSSAFAAQIAALLPARTGLFYFCSDHAAIAWHIRECVLSTGWFDALSGAPRYDLKVLSVGARATL